MPIYWFDKPENNCGILSTRLGTDCQTINGMATTYIYIMIQSLTTLVAGVVLALIYEWRTAVKKEKTKNNKSSYLRVTIKR